MSAIEELRRNDPNQTKIFIELRHYEGVLMDELTEAFAGNEHMTTIGFDFSRVRQSDWEPLLHVIATRKVLEEVALDDNMWEDATAQRLAMIRLFLRAIRQNSSVQTVSLNGLTIEAREIASFLGEATSVSTFSVKQCRMEEVTDDDLRGLEDAFARSTNIETLALREVSSAFVLPVLRGLRLNRSLKRLSVGYSRTEVETPLAIQQLLETSTSIRTFEVVDSKFYDGETLLPVAQGLVNCSTVSEVSFRGCEFIGEDTLRHFNRLLSTKQNMSSLSIHYCTFRGGQIHEALMENLQNPNCNLRCLEVWAHSLRVLFPNGTFAAFLEAVAKSKLVSLSLGSVQSQDELDAFTSIIPRTKIKKLTFNVRSDTTETKQQLLRAFSQNFSLLSVKGRTLESTLFRGGEKRTLKWYTNRNKSLAQWIKNPDTVCPGALPRAFHMASALGPVAAFSALQQIAGKISEQSKRKPPRGDDTKQASKTTTSQGEDEESEQPDSKKQRR